MTSETDAGFTRVEFLHAAIEGWKPPAAAGRERLQTADLLFRLRRLLGPGERLCGS